MFVEYYGEGAGAAVAARAGEHLTGDEPCALTVLYPPCSNKMLCPPADFNDDVVVLRTSARLNRETLVQVVIGNLVILFGTVRAVAENDEGKGFLAEVAVTSALVRDSGNILPATP
jgi:hypothetical protein